MPTCSKCICNARYVVEGKPYCGRHCRTGYRTPEFSISKMISDVIDSSYLSPSGRVRFSLPTPGRTPFASTAGSVSSSATPSLMERLEAESRSVGVSPIVFYRDVASSPIQQRDRHASSVRVRGEVGRELFVNAYTIPDKRTVDVSLSPMMSEDGKSEFQGQGSVIMTGNLPSEPNYFHIYLSLDGIVPFPSAKGVIFMPSLSSENLGSIVLRSGERCNTLENLWEFSKVAKCYVGEGGTIDPEYYEVRKRGFESDAYQYYTNDEAFFLFRGKDGKERSYTHLEAKFFFCHYFEMLVKENADFLRLKTLKEEKFNLQIAGSIFVKKTPIEHYIEDRDNFDQSMILYCMLTIEEPANYPWRVASRFGELYKDMV